MRKKIIIASDSFKGSLTSREAGMAIAKGVKDVIPEAECEIITAADGGEGTTEALTAALHGEIIEAEVSDPLHKRIKAPYGRINDTAIIEIAAASGLTLVDRSERNPMVATTYGTGELIADAIKRGCRSFLIGLGGSATNDGGTGMLRALGFRFKDYTGRDVGDGGGALHRIAKIDGSGVIPELKDCTFKVACDVNNPLTGSRGASFVFGGQKGADQEMMIRLDSGMKNFARVTAEKTGRDLSLQPGAGAAGGVGFSLLSYMNAELMPGIEMVLDAVKFDDLLNDAMLVFTGEGHLDRQTCMGKTPYGVMKRAKKMGVPVIAIGGSVDPSAAEGLINAGFSAVFPIATGPMSLTEAMNAETASTNITFIVKQILQIFRFL